MAKIIKYKMSLGIDMKSFKPPDLDESVNTTSTCSKGAITEEDSQSPVNSVPKRVNKKLLSDKVPHSSVKKTHMSNTLIDNTLYSSLKNKRKKDDNPVLSRTLSNTYSQPTAAEQGLSMAEAFESFSSSEPDSQQLLPKKFKLMTYKRNMVSNLVNDARSKKNSVLQRSQSPPNGKPTKMCEWICQICGKFFYKKQHYENHVSVHVQPKDLQCPVADCHKSFNIKEDLARHLEIHKPQDERVWFYCSTCQTRYGYGGDVVRHMKNSSNSCKLQQYKKVYPNGTVVFTGKLPPVETLL